MRFTTLATAILLLASSPALAMGDADKGKKVFKKCKSCHTVGPKAKNKVGPILNDIFGATAGTNEKFSKKYSKSMKKAGEEGLVWNEETIAEFLTKPKSFIKKTKMSFKGIKKEKDLANIIAYLATFSPDYTPARADADAEKPAEDAAMEKKPEAEKTAEEKPKTDG